MGWIAEENAFRLDDDGEPDYQHILYTLFLSEEDIYSDEYDHYRFNAGVIATTYLARCGYSVVKRMDGVKVVLETARLYAAIADGAILHPDGTIEFTYKEA